MAIAAEPRRTETMSPQGRKAVWGAFLGFFVDNFDIYLPVIVLAPAMAYFLSPDISPATTAVFSAMIFATALIGRPLGALIFGHYGDTIGRKRTAMVAVTGFGVATLLMALLPGYEQWGIASVVVFIFLRLIDGIFLGGEYTAASPLAMEYSPREKRGLYGAVIQSGAPLAFVAISVTTLLVLNAAPAGDLNSPYVQWGWRIPFFIGAALAFAFVAYYHFLVDESELWQEAEKTEAPLRTLFSGDNLKSFLQVFVLMTGLWLTLNTVTAILPGLLGSQVGLSSTDVSVTLMITYLAFAFALVGGGVLSQRIGRRNYLILSGVISATAGAFSYYLLLGTAPGNLLVVVVLTAVVTVLIVSPWAVATSYLNERFHTGVRASGFGLGYSLAVVLPSFYAFYQVGLQSFMPFEYTVVVLVVVGGALVVGGAAWGPETKDVDFSVDVPDASDPRPRARPVPFERASREQTDGNPG